MTGCGQRGAGSVRDVRTGGGPAEDGRGERPARAGAAGFRRPARLLLLALAALAIAGTPQARAQTDIWSATLMVGSAYGSLGYADGAGGSLSPTNSFRLGSTNYRVETVLTLSSGLSFATQPSLSAEVASDLTLNVGGRSLAFADASFGFGASSWSFSPALGWSVGDPVPMSITQASGGSPDTEPPVTVPDRADRRGLQTTTNWFGAPSSTVDLASYDVAQGFTTGRCEGGYENTSACPIGADVRHPAGARGSHGRNDRSVHPARLRRGPRRARRDLAGRRAGPARTDRGAAVGHAALGRHGPDRTGCANGRPRAAGRAGAGAGHRAGAGSAQPMVRSGDRRRTGHPVAGRHADRRRGCQGEPAGPPCTCPRPAVRRRPPRGGDRLGARP